MFSEKRRRLIADFLRSRRMLRQPEELGLPRGSRRRTPGLRREEVASVAGVSAEWYTWLEQARDVHPSAEVLHRIASALRLEPGEYRHLLTLAGYAVQETGSQIPAANSISLRLQRLLDQLEYCPAWAMGERLDVLGWNRAATVVHGDFTAMHGIERNALYQFFLVKAVRPMMVDWEAQTRCCTAALRASYANRVDDPWFDELIHLLRSRSPEFDRLWDAQGLEMSTEGTHNYEHPVAGRLVFDYTIMDVLDERLAPVRIATYVPAPGTGTRNKMKRLLDAAVPVPFSLEAI
ncbi:MAG TPA: helix-turn-helix transcriptional regulator [Gemmatimonadales bacterium]|jgi:transcriptional regulator with XRE-family HTH domain|nr:helix-turn-helix transcriptional regulator [Gemmatimonadales bacterium]